MAAHPVTTGSVRVVFFFFFFGTRFSLLHLRGRQRHVVLLLYCRYSFSLYSVQGAHECLYCLSFYVS